MANLNLLLAASAILGLVVTGEIIIPADLSAVSQNFHLIAHVKSPRTTEFAAGIENWEVAAIPGAGCHEPLVLRRPGKQSSSYSTNCVSVATTFFLDPTARRVQSDDARLGTTQNLFIPKPGHGERDVSMNCRLSTPRVGVAVVQDGPQLIYEPGGIFYACPRRVRGEAVAQLLYRQGLEESLPYACVDVALFAKLAEGRHHGDESSVAICTDVRDGVCVKPI
ncbi:hypothetical protein E4U21_007003 [Claviceps maximensis]|nr:hypothetical protein E4U21_007003 [Claviceps maximensis]